MGVSSHRAFHATGIAIKRFDNTKFDWNTIEKRMDSNMFIPIVTR